MFDGVVEDDAPIFHPAMGFEGEGVHSQYEIGMNAVPTQEGDQEQRIGQASAGPGNPGPEAVELHCKGGDA